MINAFLSASGLLLWAFILLVLIAEVWATEKENLWASSVIAIVALVALVLFSDIPLLAWVLDNKLLLAAAVPAYFVAGTGWAIWKWRGLVAGAVERFEELKSQLRSTWNGNYVSADGSIRKPWEEFLREKGYPPVASGNKERITSWIAFWPPSVLWWLLTYPRRAAVAIYRRLATMLDRQAASAFEGRL